jgi:hypothetical protein
MGEAEHIHTKFKTASSVCAQHRDLYKICLKSESIVNQLMGACDVLKEVHDNCLEVEFTKVRKLNLINGRKRAQQWKETRESYGLE